LNFFFSSRRRHTRSKRDWSSDVCSSDLARYVRTILCELQRIASHCLWIGTHAMDIGAMTVFLYAFRERELILDLFEEFCGARLTYNSMRIGGLPLDIPPGWDKKVLEFCTIMSSKVDEYE